MATNFTFHNEQYTIKLNHWVVMTVLPEKFDLRLLKLMADDEQTQIILGRLALDDELIIDLMWYYMEETTSFTKEETLKKLEPRDITEFREAFWKEIAHFSGPLKQEALLQGWKETKRFLKKATLDFSHLDSQVEESNSES